MLKVFKVAAETTSLMPNCTQKEFRFPSFDRRIIEASFTDGDVSSDGGIMLLRAADQRLGLVQALDAVLPDPRDPLQITHGQVDLLRHRIYGLALGCEDPGTNGDTRTIGAASYAAFGPSERHAGPRMIELEAGTALPLVLYGGREAGCVREPTGSTACALLAAARRNG